MLPANSIYVKSSTTLGSMTARQSMNTIKDMVRHSVLYQKAILPVRSFWEWRLRGYADHSPQTVKQRVLARNSTEGSTWVETGTYLGTTTDFLSSNASMVHTVEPEPNLYERAKNRFSGKKNVNVINGTSEEVFPKLLPTLKGDINFWLDGHYSAGSTFQGKNDCPVEEELKAISSNLANFGRVSLLIDDVRCFLPRASGYDDYPSIDFLVDWARRHAMYWHIEHDIFVATNYK